MGHSHWKCTQLHSPLCNVRQDATDMATDMAGAEDCGAVVVHIGAGMLSEKRDAANADLMRRACLAAARVLRGDISDGGGSSSSAGGSDALRAAG